MAMIVLLARERATDVQIRVHLDTTRLDKDGNPDPAAVAEWIFSKSPPDGVTRADYLARVRSEVRLLARDEALRRGLLASAAETVLPFEGQAP